MHSARFRTHPNGGGELAPHPLVDHTRIGAMTELTYLSAGMAERTSL